MNSGNPKPTPEEFKSEFLIDDNDVYHNINKNWKKTPPEISTKELVTYVIE